MAGGVGPAQLQQERDPIFPREPLVRDDGGRDQVSSELGGLLAVGGHHDVEASGTEAGLERGEHGGLSLGQDDGARPAPPGGHLVA